MPFALKLPRRNPDAPRPSLRERYAALKGSAAKVIGKPARFTPPKPTGAGEPSKALAALIDAHQLAYGRYLIARSDWTPDLDALRQAEEEAFRALLHSPLRSDADRAAYAVAVIERQSGALGDHVASGRDHPLAVAYRSLRFGEHAREPEETRPAEQEPEAEADPILAAIAASKAATAAFDAFEAELERYGKTSGWAAREGYLSDTDLRAQKAVWQTVPTTPAGRRALVEFARTQVQRRTNPNGDVDDSAWLLGRILDAFTAMVADPSEAWPAQAPVAHPPKAVKADDDAHARLSAEQIDLTALDVFQLSGLFEAYQVARFSWEGVEQRPYSYERGTDRLRHLTELGKVARFEEERASWIMHRLEQEIVSRKPEDNEQRDEILIVRTQQEFRCNMRIHDNALLHDITQAWSA